MNRTFKDKYHKTSNNTPPKYSIGDVVKFDDVTYFLEFYNGHTFLATPVDDMFTYSIDIVCDALETKDKDEHYVDINDVVGVEITSKLLYSIGFDEYEDDGYAFHVVINKSLCPESLDEKKNFSIYWHYQNGFAFQGSKKHILDDDFDDSTEVTVFFRNIIYVHQVQHILRLIYSFSGKAYRFDPFKYEEVRKS